MAFALPAALRRACVQRFVLAIEFVNLLFANKSELVVDRRPRVVIQSRENQMRPWLALRIRVSEQMDARVWMSAKIIPLERWRAENFLKPAQIPAFRKSGAKSLAPAAT